MGAINPCVGVGKEVSTKRIPITIRGKTYRSIHAASVFLGLNAKTVRSAYLRGKLDTCGTMVRPEGIEPPLRKEAGYKPAASANSATSAWPEPSEVKMKLQDLNVGENYVYHSGLRGWQDVPKPLKEEIMEMVNAGQIAHFTRRNAAGGFDMVVQRLKSRK